MTSHKIASLCPLGHKKMEGGGPPLIQLFSLVQGWPKTLHAKKCVQKLGRKNITLQKIQTISNPIPVFETPEKRVTFIAHKGNFPGPN